MLPRCACLCRRRGAVDLDWRVCPAVLTLATFACTALAMKSTSACWMASVWLGHSVHE